MDSKAPTPPLDYARPTSGVNKKWLWRSIVIVAVIVAGFHCRDWPGLIYNDIHIFYLQRQCLNHPVPAGVIVYSSGPPSVSIRSPQCAALYGPCPFKFTFGVNNSNAVVTVFTGQLQACNGARRFVTVEASVAWTSGKSASVGFATTTSQLARADTAQCGLMGGSTFSWGFVPVLANPQVIVQSAVLDPSDSSHFSFTTSVFNEHEHWDGNLQPDGTLKMIESTTWTTLPATAPVSGRD